MRILIGPSEIAGIGSGLYKGFRQLGVDAQLVYAYRHPFKYETSEDGFFIKFWQFLGWVRGRAGIHIFTKALIILFHRLIGFFVFVWALFRFDAFIFIFGLTLTDTKLELKLLRFFNKKIIFINCGSDIRPPYMDGAIFPQNISVSSKSIYKRTRKSKLRAVLHQKYANYIVAQPSNAHFYEKEIINYLTVGVPVSVAVENFIAEYGEVNRRTRVVHSPSNKSVKGSDFICNVIQKLIDKGRSIELICLNNVSNDQVLRALSECDFVVDQLYSDLPIAVLGIEAACFAKPCVVAGYLGDAVGLYFPIETIPPCFYVDPEGLEEAIEKLLDNQKMCSNLGRSAQQFVLEKWNCKSVAERYLMLLHDKPQSNWWFSPNNITYVGGCGLSLNKIAERVGNLVEQFGVGALHVEDKPNLEEALLRLAKKLPATSDA